MSGPSARVFVARLAGTAFFDPNGDAVGKVRDVVVAVRHRATAGPRTRRRGAPRRGIFLAITRVTSIDAGQVITTGLVNMRRFQRQPYGTLALAELLDRTARVRATGEELVVYDLGLDLRRSRDWVLTKVAVQRRSKRFSRRGETRIYDWAEVSGLTSPEGEQGAANLVAALDQMRAADRDRVNLEQDREVNARSRADMEFLAREIASIRFAMGEMATRDYLRAELRDLVEELRDGLREEGLRARTPAD